MDEFEKMNYRIHLAIEEEKGLVLGIHGFSGSGKSATLKKLGAEVSQKGYMMIAFDLPSHGVNQSTVLKNLDECLKGVETAVSYAQTFCEPLSVFATSFGAYLTLLYISRYGNPFQKVILRAPAVYMDETFDGLLDEKGYDRNAEVWKMGYDYPLYVDRQFSEDLKSNRLEGFDFPSCDLTVIQGQKDTMVDWRKNEIFFREKFGDKVSFKYLPKADHFFGKEGEQERIVDIVLFALDK